MDETRKDTPPTPPGPASAGTKTFAQETPYSEPGYGGRWGPAGSAPGPLGGPHGQDTQATQPGQAFAESEASGASRPPEVHVEGGFDYPPESKAPSGQDRGEDRSWWSRTRDEVGALLGDEAARRRRQMDAHNPDQGADSRRDDTGWNDPFPEGGRDEEAGKPRSGESEPGVRRP